MMRAIAATHEAAALGMNAAGAGEYQPGYSAGFSMASRDCGKRWASPTHARQRREYRHRHTLGRVKHEHVDRHRSQWAPDPPIRAPPNVGQPAALARVDPDQIVRQTMDSNAAALTAYLRTIAPALATDRDADAGYIDAPRPVALSSAPELARATPVTM